MKNLTNTQYKKMTEQATPNTPPITIVTAFIVGGGICLVGQVIFTWLAGIGLDEQACSSAVTVIMIFFGGLLTAFNVYDNIAKHAGAGTIVPITGFANSIVAPAMEFKQEGFVLGVGAKMFVVAGPVIVYGVASSVLIGLIKFFIDSASI